MSLLTAGCCLTSTDVHTALSPCTKYWNEKLRCVAFPWDARSAPSNGCTNHFPRRTKSLDSSERSIKLFTALKRSVLTSYGMPLSQDPLLSLTSFKSSLTWLLIDSGFSPYQNSQSSLHCDNWFLSS